MFSISLSVLDLRHFAFMAPPPTEICTLSLHDALPILMTVFNGMASEVERLIGQQQEFVSNAAHELRNPLNALLLRVEHLGLGDRKSTRLNSSHVAISYAVFCLKKKNTSKRTTHSEQLQ